MSFQRINIIISLIIAIIIDGLFAIPLKTVN